jgi:HD-GYP domain-containing protein (c-di-GMP phosphodiesterase class II)
LGVSRTSQIDRTRWQAHPILARGLSLTVFVVPLGGSYAATRLAAPLVAGLPLLGRIVALGSLAIIVGLLIERTVRRVLPLAALLRMTLLFPDRAPSRYKMARSAGNTRVLVERARAHPNETAGEAATRILGLVSALSAHDRRTRGHSERVRVFTDVLAAELHLSQPERDRLRWAALLHDIGKIGVPAGVLNKVGKLDDGEWTQIRRHPDQGAALVAPLMGWLGEWGAAIPEHHERVDGKGYPRGLAGHEIALAARIVAVADVFEVMTAARSYKRPVSVAAARRELADVAGTQLDPACVRAFLGASLPRVLWAVGPLALLVNLPFLRGLAEAGRVVEHAGTTAAGQAATVSAAATVAVVLAVPATSPAIAADHSSELRTHGSTSAPFTAAGASPSAGRTAGSNAPGRAGPASAGAPSFAGISVRNVPAGSSPAPRSTSPSAAGAAKAPAAPGVPTSPRVPGKASSPSADPTRSPSSSTPELQPVSLGNAANFAVLAGSTITNTGTSTITGLLGLSPGTAVTGFLTPSLIESIHASDNIAVRAKTDLADAYGDAAGRATTATVPVELGGTTKTPGVYDSAAGTFGITGTLTLDAQGDPNAVFIFKAASTLTTASASHVKLINGANAANVFWQVGSSATLGTNSVLRGNVLALASITVTTGATVDGRMLARTGAVTLDTDTITRTAGGH